MPLSDIVDVVITRQTQTVSEAGFGTPMILGTNNHFNDLIRFYTDMDEVALDFDPNDPEYIAAQDIFSQVISPNRIAIGRRLANNAVIKVQTAMTNEAYRLFINGNEISVQAISVVNYSVVTLNDDLESGNRINVSLNGTTIGTITSQIDFDTDFVTGNSIVAVVNGVNMAPVAFTGSQAATMTALAASIATLPSVASATVTDLQQITVEFAAEGVTNTINDVNTTGGATQPIAEIAEGGFVFTTNTENTLQMIADQIILQLPTFSANVSGVPARVLTVSGSGNISATINAFTIQGGINQPTAVITLPLTPVTPEDVISRLVSAVNSLVVTDPTFPVSATTNLNGTFNLTNRFPGVAWTLRVSTSITNPNSALVRVTQLIPSNDYTITLNGVDFTVRSPNNVQNINQIASLLVDEINRVPQSVLVDATLNSDGSIDLQSQNASNTFSVTVSQETMSVQFGLIVLPLVASNPVATDLTAINNVDSSWYALISVSRDVPTVKSIAAWVETRIKLFGTASSDPTIINVAAGTDTTSIAAFLNQSGYVRSFVMYHQDADYDYPEAAWFGRVLPLNPGSETWKFKTLNSISYSNLTTTQSNNALNKRANTYEFVAGVGITSNGTVAQGEFIDIVRGIDWLTARMQEFVFSILVNNPKVPYTNAGIAAVEAEVRRALQQGVDNDFITTEPPFTVSVPLAQNVPSADKANRILRNVSFRATLSGAIHAVVIRGNISV